MPCSSVERCPPRKGDGTGDVITSGGVQNRDRLCWLLRVCQGNYKAKREQAKKKFRFHPPTYAPNRESETALIDQPLLDARVSIDPPIAQEGPVGPMSIDHAPIDPSPDNFFAID